MKKTLRQKQMEETKDVLFQTSVSLFKEKGYKNSTIQEICKICGVAKGTFYSYFKSKEDIIKMSFRNGIDSYLEKNMMEYKLENPEASIKEQLLFYILLSFRYCKDVGKEMTTQAYIFNLNQQLSENRFVMLSEERNTILNNLIKEGFKQECWSKLYTESDVLRLFEIYITGAMLTWCYAIEDFDIVEENTNLTSNLLDTLTS